jgi:putative endonuclease
MEAQRKGHRSRGRWSVYVIRCRDRSLYTGIATDVARRFAEHQKGGGKGAKYLSGRGPLRLVFQHTVGSRSRALKVEYRIKRLTKAKKERLVRSGDLSIVTRD